MIHRLARALVVAGIALVVAAPLAGAHVTVNPGEAPKGGFAKLAFRVPNERPDSGTTTLEVNLPEDQPIANVSVRPKQGWTYQVETRQLDEPIDNHGEELTEVVSKVTWKLVTRTGRDGSEFGTFFWTAGTTGGRRAVADGKAEGRRPCSSPCQGQAATVVTVELPLRRWRRVPAQLGAGASVGQWASGCLSGAASVQAHIPARP